MMLTEQEISKKFQETPKKEDIDNLLSKAKNSNNPLAIHVAKHIENGLWYKSYSNKILLLLHVINILFKKTITQGNVFSARYLVNLKLMLLKDLLAPETNFKNIQKNYQEYGKILESFDTTTITAYQSTTTYKANIFSFWELLQDLDNLKENPSNINQNKLEQ